MVITLSEYCDLRSLEWFYLSLAYEQFGKNETLHWMYLFDYADYATLADEAYLEL